MTNVDNVDSDTIDFVEIFNILKKLTLASFFNPERKNCIFISKRIGKSNTFREANINAPKNISY